MAATEQAEIEYTEAQLSGEDSEPAGEKAEVVPGAEPTPSEPKAAEEPKAAAEPVAEPVKLPADDRRVPLRELISERQKRQELQSRLDALEAARNAEPAKDPRELILEDPQEAMGLLVQRIEELQSEISRKELEREITSSVPDFFDKAPQMEELLLSEGFSEETIRNMIGSTGKEAPKLFKVLSKLVDVSDSAAMRAKIIEEVTPQITKTLMEKFKITEPGKNINRLPGSSPDGSIAVDGEKGFAKLTPEQQEAWLKGEI